MWGVELQVTLRFPFRFSMRAGAPAFALHSRKGNKNNRVYVRTKVITKPSAVWDTNGTYVNKYGGLEQLAYQSS